MEGLLVFIANFSYSISCVWLTAAESTRCFCRSHVAMNKNDGEKLSGKTGLISNLT